MIDDSFFPYEVKSRQQIIPRPASIVSLGYNQSVNLNWRKSVPAKFSYFLRKDFFLSWDDNEERFPFRLVGVFLSRGWRGNDQL